MKLKSVRVTEFRSVTDSGEFEVGDITCLVGKNEAGKTAVLQALHRLNPLDETAGKFSVTDDYPRAVVSDYEQQVKNGKRAPASAVAATFELSDAEKHLIEEEFGTECLTSNRLILQRGYSDTTNVELSMDEGIACRHLVARAEMPALASAAFLECRTLEELSTAVEAAQQDEHTKRLTNASDRGGDRQRLHDGSVPEAPQSTSAEVPLLRRVLPDEGPREHRGA